MKNYFKIIILIFIFSLSFTSCETTEEIDLPRNAKPVVNVDTPSIQLSENGTATITISTDTPINKSLVFKLIQVEGNAVKDEDYAFAQDSDQDYGEIGGKIVIPAHESTGSTTISGITDFGADNGKAVFKLEAMESMNGLVGTNDKVTVAVDDYIGGIIINLGWTVDDENIDVCEQDLDLFIHNGSAHVAVAATADCIEHAALTLDDPDGVYFVDVDYWAPGAVTEIVGDPAEYNTTFYLTKSQVGVYSDVPILTGTASSSHFLNWSGFSAFGGDGYHPNVMKITKTGSDFVIQ